MSILLLYRETQKDDYVAVALVEETDVTLLNDEFSEHVELLKATNEPDLVQAAFSLFRNSLHFLIAQETDEFARD